MAYSPIDQGRLLKHPDAARIARTRNATPAQVALAWVLQQADVLAIPKATGPDHVRQNRAALDIHLTREESIELDRDFPPPRRKVPLEMLRVIRSRVHRASLLCQGAARPRQAALLWEHEAAGDKAVDTNASWH